MALGLVARSARALSDHLNFYYRVFKGIDPDSIWLRLAAGGGSFQVRHSATNAPLLTVTDAGLALPAGSITGAMIADGTITGADIAPATITSDKLAGGIPVPANSITTAEIQNGTIQAVDVALGALTATASVTAFPVATGTVNSTGTWFGVPDSPVAVFVDHVGEPVVLLASLQLSHSVAGGRFQIRAATSPGGVPVGAPSSFVGAATAGQAMQHTLVALAPAPTSGTLGLQLQILMIDAGAGTIVAGLGQLHVVALHR